jgi:hypothetical protein
MDYSNKMVKPTSNTNRKKTRRFSKKFLAAGAVILVVAIITVLELTNTTHFFHKPASEVIVKAGKPTAVAKNNSSVKQKPPQKTPSNANVHVVSGGSDTNGSASASTSPSQWVVSKSGDITVKQPIANATFHSGDTLSGSAKVGVISFRLIDDDVGVISQGTLNVVNGDFSGTLNFTPQAPTGRLDVFTTNDQGVELNEVQISVRF